MDRLPPLPKCLAKPENLQHLTTDERNEKAIHEDDERLFGLEEVEPQHQQQQQNNSDNESSWRLDQKMLELRREMIELRRMDMSLLSQLNALRDSIINYKRAFNIDNSGEYDDNCDYQNYMPYLANTAGSYKYLKRNENERCSDEDSDDDVDDDNANDNASDLSDEREDTTESSHSTV